MRVEERDGLRGYRFEQLPDGVDVLVTTRPLNVGWRGGDPHDVVAANRRRWFSAFGLELERSVWTQQVHGVTVAFADEPGRGAVSADTLVEETDALVTDLVGVPLCVVSADCVPVVLYDPEHHAAGVAHAGWKGTTGRIGSATVRAMTERFGTDPAAVTAAIGPSVAPARYEVDASRIAAARAAFGDAPIAQPTVEGKALLDLWRANALDLAEAGVERIEVAGVDTTGDFFSHRAGDAGRFATVVTLTRDPR